MRRGILWILGLAVVALGLLWFLLGRTDAMRIDACLDRGGAWDYAERRCELPPEGAER